MSKRVGRPRLAALLPAIGPLAAIAVAITFATTSRAEVEQHPRAASAPTCEVSYRVTHTWGDGYQAEVTVRNTGPTTLSEWILTWRNPDGLRITDVRNGRLRTDGADVSVANAPWNADISPHAAVMIGFTVTVDPARPRAGDPSGFRLDGSVCALA